MKTLEKIEKKSETWFLLIITFIFFLLRLPSLIEPIWYGDEAIYMLIGMALNKGRLLYSQIWDNKPPLLYIIYALANGDQYTVRLLSLLFGGISVVFFYYLSKKLFYSHKISVIITTFYVLLFSTPFLEGNIANAENFILLPIITAALLIYKTSGLRHLEGGRLQRSGSHDSFQVEGIAKPFKIGQSSSLMLFLAGLLLGIAFLFKIVALFDFAAFFLFLLFTFLPEKFSIITFSKIFPQVFRKTSALVYGFLLPILATVFFFIVRGALGDFLTAVFFSNIGYVNYANKFIIPQGFLILKLLLLLTALILIFWKRKIISRNAAFIFIWFFFSLFNATFSGRPWTHYLLVLAPSASLMIGLLFDSKLKKLRICALTLLIILIYFSTALFKISIRSFARVGSYYQNFTLFITNKKSIQSYMEFFDKKTTRDYEIAEFIAHKTKINDAIFIWGNDPQIYVLSRKLPPGKYTVEYHINQSKNSVLTTAADIKKTKPKYIIILPEVQPLPFYIGRYVNKYNLKGASFYEKTF